MPPLPFLKPKHVAGTIMAVKVRPPDVTEDKSSEDQENAGLMSAASDLITAVQANDHKAAAQALRAAFEILDSSPHDEGPHTNDNTEEQQ